MTFRLRPQAVADVEAIANLISAERPGAAESWLRSIHAKCRLLGEHPESGPARDDIRPGLRFMPVGQYLIFYRVVGREPEIVRVLHGARDLRRALDLS